MTTDNTQPVAWIAFDQISGEYFLEREPDSAITWTPLFYATPQPVIAPALTHDNIRSVGGIIQRNGNLFFPNIKLLNKAIEKAFITKQGGAV